LRTRAIPERLGGVFTTRRYTDPSIPLPLPYLSILRVTVPTVVLNDFMCCCPQYV